jgi:Concanavalin A-like lectin/glucanases superfamily
MRILTILIVLLSTFCTFAQSLERRKTSVVWKIDNVKKIGGHPVEVLGSPRVVKTDRGNAVEFDGVRDGIFIQNNPLAGADKFTIEAIFRPDEGGGAEQRWLHIEDKDNVESRAMLETRLTGKEWFLDTFLKSGDNRMPLYAENFKHPTGQWFHVALVYDGTEMRHYIDGKLELSGKIDFKTFGKGVTSIGVRQNKVFWFKGAVLKARFTHRSLPPAEFMK